MLSKSVKSGVAAFVLGLALAVPASAATFNISFTQDGVGDAGADWFGTFEAPSSGGVVSVFSALINGTTYNIPDPDFFPNLSANETFFFNFATINDSGIVLQTVLSAAYQVALGLRTDNTWAFESCNTFECQHNGSVGTYSISAVSEVPVPAALPLLVAGLGALGFTGWRRKRKLA